MLQAVMCVAAADLAIMACINSAVSQHDSAFDVPQMLGQSGACSVLQNKVTHCKQAQFGKKGHNSLR